MRRPNVFRRGPGLTWGLAAIAALSVGADEPKQTIKARGLTFEAPKAWKSSPPTSQFRIAQLKVEPIEGDDYPAEAVITAFPGGAGSVEENVRRWQSQFTDDAGNPPKIETTKVKGKNVEVVRVETHGNYHPPSFGGPRQPERKGARLLGAMVMAGDVSYYIRMVGPDRTMKKLTPDFDEMLKTIKIEE